MEQSFLCQGKYRLFQWGIKAGRHLQSYEQESLIISEAKGMNPSGFHHFSKNQKISESFSEN